MNNLASFDVTGYKKLYVEWDKVAVYFGYYNQLMSNDFGTNLADQGYIDNDNILIGKAEYLFEYTDDSQVDANFSVKSCGLKRSGKNFIPFSTAVGYSFGTTQLGKTIKFGVVVGSHILNGSRIRIYGWDVIG